MNKYLSVNPVSYGTESLSCSASDPYNAAKQIWSKMTTHFDGAIDSFAFTLSDTANNLHSFSVTETLDKSGKVKYHIDSLHGKMTPLQQKRYLSRISSIQSLSHSQSGGGEPVSEEDKKIYKRLKKLRAKSKKDNTPIASWYYYPNLYPYFYNYDYITFPSFRKYLLPDIYLDLAYPDIWA
jgi:hypothetical protein